jgi:hypothetical protein
MFDNISSLIRSSTVASIYSTIGFSRMENAFESVDTLYDLTLLTTIILRVDNEPTLCEDSMEDTIEYPRRCKLFEPEETLNDLTLCMSSRLNMEPLGMDAEETSCEDSSDDDLTILLNYYMPEEKRFIDHLFHKKIKPDREKRKEGLKRFKSLIRKLFGGLCTR